MKDINNSISKLKTSFDEKAESLLTLNKAYEWFMKNLPFTYHHQDLRGGDTNPVIILSTKDDVVIDIEQLQKDFEQDVSYPLFKKYLLALGTTKSSLGDTYFYIQCNNDYTGKDIKRVMFNRCNKELFPHINKYF